MEKPIEKALDECLFFSVKKLDRLLSKLADEAFRKTGLAPTYGFILLILKEKDGIPQKILHKCSILRLQQSLVLLKN